MAQTRGGFSQLYDNTDRKVGIMLNKQLKELPDIWRKVTKVESSDRQTEISLSVVGFGDVPERPEGEPFATDIIQPGHQKTVTHSGWGLGFEATIEAMEDDRYGQLKKYPMWLSFTAGYTLEKRAANLFNNGFTTELTADGVSLFNASHPLIRGGTARNMPSGGAGVNLSWSAIKDAIVDLATETKHDSGQIALATQDLILYVPPQLEMLADRLLNSTNLPGSADNDRNSVKSRRNISIEVNPLLTDTNAWFLISKNKEMHGVKAFERVPITPMEPDTDPRTKSRLYTLRFRYSFFADTWQNSWGSAGA
jgi:hypothetical protein